MLNLVDTFSIKKIYIRKGKYVRAVSTTKNPTESEIIINVPLALQIMTTGYIWPISAWQELISGDLVAADENVTVSPR